MRHIDNHERRARLGIRHLLAPGTQADDVVRVTRDLVALHSTDPATVMLSALARMRGGTIAAIEDALYEQRTLVRLLGMRRTMFVVPTELVGVVLASSTRALLPGERRRTVGLIEDSAVAPDGEVWLKAVEEETLAALRERGQATAAQLSGDVPGLREQIVAARGARNEATQRLSTRVLFLLAAEGRIIRGRPAGSWISSQYRWAPVEAWLPEGVHDLSVEAAQAELVRRWLARFGPATEADVKWWTGWTVTAARRAIAAVGAVGVTLDDGATGYVLADDLDEVPPPEPWAALLPGLDPTPMGWMQRGWYLGGHKARVFDNTGNVGPTVWWDGRIVGGWAQRTDGDVVWHLLEDIGADGEAAVGAEGARLAKVLGVIRVTPRFRTPLERELVA